MVKEMADELKSNGVCNDSIYYHFGLSNKDDVWAMFNDIKVIIRSVYYT